MGNSYTGLLRRVPDVLPSLLFDLCSPRRLTLRLYVRRLCSLSRAASEIFTTPVSGFSSSLIIALIRRRSSAAGSLKRSKGQQRAARPSTSYAQTPSHMNHPPSAQQTPPTHKSPVHRPALPPTRYSVHPHPSGTTPFPVPSRTSSPLALTVLPLPSSLTPPTAAAAAILA